MQYKIRNRLIPIPESHRQPILATLEMYDRGEDLTNSPLIQSRVNLTHMDVYYAEDKEAALQERQKALIDLYESIRTNGYDGSTILVWFDEEGFIRLYDGYHRLVIMEHLGMDVPVNVETQWEGIDGSVGKDFPLAEVLKLEHPLGEWLYQPVSDNRLKGWEIDRKDSPQRLEYILENAVGKTVLDIGCSEGYFSRELAKRGYQVTGIDVRRGFVAAARYLSTLEGVSVDYHLVGDWEEFLCENGYYDNILFLSVIHNDMKKIGVEAGFKKLEAFRGKAGRLFLETPQENGERQWNVPGYPQFTFQKEENVERVEGAIQMVCVQRWSAMPGGRSIFIYGSDAGQVVPDGLTLVRGVQGFNMYLPAKEPIVTPWVVKTKTWEPKLTEWLKKNLKEGQTFVDVGAHVGYYSLLASKLVGSSGKVVAFEPDPDNFSTLQKNIRLNGFENIEAHNAAISNSPGRVELFIYGSPSDTGRRGLTPVENRDEAWRARNPQAGESGTVTVDAMRLTKDLIPRADFIKVDVEGGERDALEGMADVLLGDVSLILEDESDNNREWINQRFGLDLAEVVSEETSALKHYIYRRDDVPWWDLNKWLPDYRSQYWPLFNTLRTKPCSNIMEVGTHNGKNAIVMIKTAAQKVPEDEIHYYGFDLFEEKTEEIQQQEFTPVSDVKMADVEAYIMKHTKAKVSLFRGNTRVILKDIVKSLPIMDLIYIDGGHSIETTRNDWKYASKLVGKDTVVYFDDYDDEMPFIGSHFIVGELDSKYVAEVLPQTNYYERPFGRLKCQLLRVTVRKPAPKLKTEHFRFHLISLPHSVTIKNWGPCAFTQLTYRFSKMLHDMGHEVYHYGTEGADVTCTEHIDVLTREVQKQAYGDFNQWKQLWIHNGKDLAYTTFRKNAITELNRRKEPGDILLISNGNWLREISDVAGGGMATVEPFVGYLGFYAKYKVFPSYAWMHHMYGKISRSSMEENFVTGNWYDAVIPHFFDPADHTFEEKKDDYFLYLGRLIQRKGVHVAVDICQRLGAKLIVCGQPLYPSPKEKLEWSLRSVGILDKDNQPIPNVEFVPPASFELADRLRSKAKAVIIPSLYLEPFGMVVPEALLSGTPVITTDWGAFPEIVKQGEVGYRCRTMDDFIWAANNIHKISPAACREYAVKNFSMDRISKAYQEYFVKVHDLFDKGWYAEHQDREELDWLRRY